MTNIESILLTFLLLNFLGICLIIIFFKNYINFLNDMSQEMLKFQSKLEFLQIAIKYNRTKSESIMQQTMRMVHKQDQMLNDHETISDLIKISKKQEKSA